MKTVSLFVISIAIFISACGVSNKPASSNTASSAQTRRDELTVADSASNTNVASAQHQVANASGHGSGSGFGIGGGGGGGGRMESLQQEAQKISLEQASDSQIDSTQSSRKIIRNADLGLEVDDPEQTQQRITSIAENAGGFVVESQQSSSDVRSVSRDLATMSIRVPSNRFDETLVEIRKAAGRVLVESVKGQDVTEEFIDIDAQIKTKKALEQQFMEIMKRANTVEDALSVQSELATVRGEIEKIEGRRRFLENQSSLSTIKIKLQTPVAIAASSDGFGDRLTDSFGRGFEVALNFVLGLVTFLVAVIPFALFIGLPLGLIFRYFWRKQNKSSKSVGEIAKEELSIR